MVFVCGRKKTSKQVKRGDGGIMQKSGICREGTKSNEWSWSDRRDKAPFRLAFFGLCGKPILTSTRVLGLGFFFYLAREGDSPEMEARTRGRAGEEGVDGSAVPAAEPVAGLGVDIRGSLFLGSSTQTRLFLTFSRQLSSQNQALSEDATSSEMGVSPWHFWWKALGQPSQRIMTFPGADSCD